VRAYKRLLASPAGDRLRARALLGLARAYEAQKLWVPARDAYAQLLARYPKVDVEDEGSGGERPAGALVAARLERPPVDRMGGDRAEPRLPAPLARRWSRSIGTDAHPLAADGVPPSPESGRIFVAGGNELRPLDAAAGTSRWSADLGGAPLWV